MPAMNHPWNRFNSDRLKLSAARKLARRRKANAVAAANYQDPIYNAAHLENSRRSKLRHKTKP